MISRLKNTFRSFSRSRRAVEVLTGNLLMIMVMAAVFSSIAFLVKGSSDRYADAQERQMIDSLSSHIKSKVSEAWGVGADEVPLELPEIIGSGHYIIETDPSGNYLRIRTDRSSYRIRSSGIQLGKRSISSSQTHYIGIREGKVLIDPPPLTEISFPLDGSVFSGSFNLSYRTSDTAEEHYIYLDGLMVASGSGSFDGFLFNPSSSPTNMTDGTHSITVVTENDSGEGSDTVRFTMDRTPPNVNLNLTQIDNQRLTLTVTETRPVGNRVEAYIFVTDDKNLPVRGLDTDNFYVYNSQDELANGGRFTLSINATDGQSRIDPTSYLIKRNHSNLIRVTRSRDDSWDSKGFNGTVSFQANVSDIAGNVQTSSEVSKSPVSRPVEVGAPDRKSDLSLIFTNDVSGSMEWVMWKDEYPKPGEESRLDFMKAAVKSFISRMYPEDEAAVCSFTTNYATGMEEIVLEKNFTATDTTGKSQLSTCVDGLSTIDGTPLYDALYQSLLWVRERSKFKAVLVLTDGKDLNYATGKPYSTRTSTEVIDLARAEGIPIYCVGLGEEDKVDVNVLNAISEQTEGRLYLAPTPEKLQEAYDQIAGELLSGYRLTYTPGFFISGGEEINLVVYDDEDRSGKETIILPEPENLPPQVTLSAPNGGEVWEDQGTIEWSATDDDGDPLTFDLYYSDDAGTNWNGIASDLSGTGPDYTYLWDTSGLPEGDQYKVKVVADDDQAQSSDQSASVFEIDD